MELPKRLAVLAACVLQGKAADIGTDHAYLPIYLVEQGICNTVIATDLRDVSGKIKYSKNGHIKYSNFGH